MNYTFETILDEEHFHVRIKKRKYPLVILETKKDISAVMSSFVASDLPEPQKIFLLIVQIELEDDEMEELWEMHDDVEIHTYEQSTEIEIPIDLFWDVDFLEYAKKRKWFKYKLEVSKDGKTTDGSKGEKGKRKEVNSFGDKLRKWVGIPTEEEWIEKNENKKDITDWLQKKKRDSNR